MKEAVAAPAPAASVTVWRCGGRECAPGACDHDVVHRATAGPTRPEPPPLRHRVSSPTDAAELEADQAADLVLRGQSVTVLGSRPVGPVLRKGSADLSEWTPDEERVQRSADPAAPTTRPVPAVTADPADSLDDRIRGLRGRGSPLDQGTRTLMERGFGHDFGRVRVHVDDDAARAARGVHALAFTVGPDIAFAPGRYQPGSTEGRRLLAHELTHVVQQSPHGPTPGGGLLQRDLATAPPVDPVRDQADLTDAQISAAIAFNRNRYDEQNTRLIQQLLGGPVTGTWTRENIIAIAATQEQYGLEADGKVGHDTFVFLNNEQDLEGKPTDDANCLTGFAVNVAPVEFVTTNPGRLQGFFTTASEFSSRCDCSQFQYRQFIRGHARHIRGATVTNLAGAFPIPGGRLPTAFREDGDTTDNPVHYGHRDERSDNDPVDQYVNDANRVEQIAGCRYRSNDRPGLRDITNLATGDVFDLDINFRGEIQRGGVPVRTRQWTAINGRFVVP